MRQTLSKLVSQFISKLNCSRTSKISQRTLVASSLVACGLGSLSAPAALKQNSAAVSADSTSVSTTAPKVAKKWSFKFQGKQHVSKPNFEAGNFDDIKTDGSTLTLKYKLNSNDSISALQKFNLTREAAENKFAARTTGISFSRNQLTQIGGYDLMGSLTYFAPTGLEAETGKNEFRTFFAWERPIAAKTTLGLSTQQRFYFYNQDFLPDTSRYLFITGADISYEVNKYLGLIYSMGHTQAKKLFPSPGKSSQIDTVYLDLGVSIQPRDDVKVVLFAEQESDIRGGGTRFFSDDETSYRITLEVSL